MFRYLGDHPNVFVPRRKEPHHYARDIRGYAYIQDRDAYLDLFAEATVEHAAIGEGSVYYLYSEVAVPSILAERPDARFIVCLRDPVEMFRSLHRQLVTSQQEVIADPESAWRACSRRREKRDVPTTCEDEKLLLYDRTCLLGRQVRRLLATTGGVNVLFLFMDDLKHDPGREYRKALSFLGLDDDGRSEFPRVNVAHRPRWPRLATLHYRLDRALVTRPELGPVRRALLWTRPMVRAFRERSKMPASKHGISKEFESELYAYFADDIDLLADCVGRDLSPWKAGRGLERDA